MALSMEKRAQASAFSMFFQKKVKDSMSSSLKGRRKQNGPKYGQKRRLLQCFAPFERAGFEHTGPVCKITPNFGKVDYGHDEKTEKANKMVTILCESGAMFTELAHEQKTCKMTFLQPR